MIFPGGSEVNNLPANRGDPLWFLGLGRSPEEGNGSPLQYSCLENSMDRAPGGLQSRTQLMDQTTPITYLIYNIILISDVQQGDSVIYTHIPISNVFPT